MDLRKRIDERPVLCDGGMGTQLIEAGLPTGVCGVAWNVDQPQTIKAVHARYADAGCDLITTNTFQATRTALAMHGLSERVRELNRAAAEVARRAAGPDRWVLADVGPFGGFLEPVGETTFEELTDIFTEALAALREGGADAALIETMSDPEELCCAVRAAKALGDWPVIATFAFQHAGEGFATMMGTSVEAAMGRAAEVGADIIGANCGTELSLDDYRRLAAQLVAAAGDRPVILQPNAGSPKHINGQLVYEATPHDMADLVPDLLNVGVRVIGGCCGTTPDHLRAMAGRLTG